jgi:hypothetical protein
MINTDSKLITSVMGFNLKVTVKDENNQMVKTGILNILFNVQKVVYLHLRIE